MAENKNAKTPADDGQPVAWLDAEMSQAYTIDELPDASGTGFLPLYTAPPKREWVGLTLNEAEDLYEKYTDRAELINAVDKFLVEKNS